MRKLRTFLLGPVAAVVLAATAAAEGLDLSGLSARVDAALADEATPAAQRKRYAMLRRALDHADAPGLIDDFARIERVAREVRGALADDAELAAAAATALDEGLTALGGVRAAVTVSSIDIESAVWRNKVERRLRRSRAFESRARTQRVLGRPDRACSNGRRSAEAVQRAALFAERGLRRQDAAPPTWKIVLDGLDAALLSVHVAATDTSPVFVVGAADSLGPTFLRGGREGFVRIPVGGQGDLWWVDGVPGAGVWACGEEGRVVVYDPATGAIADRSVAEQTGILYGVWGAGADDVWTVGEDPDGDGPLSAAFHWDGATWQSAALPEAAGGLTLYKVWGAAPDDVWACGRAGLLLRFDGSEWRQVASGTTSSLLTVHGGDAGIAVGLAPVISERGPAGTWATVGVPPGTESLNGVRVGEDGDAWAVGYFRTVLRRTPRGWARQTTLPVTQGRDYHSVTIDAAGGVWIAGGTLTTMANGTLLHRGPREFAASVLPRATLTEHVRPIFTRSCAETACHAPPYLSQGLDLATDEGLRARVVGVLSRQSPFPLVSPGRPTASYLLRKLEGTHLDAGGSGVTMPQDEALPPEDVTAIRAWILEGALGE